MPVAAVNVAVVAAAATVTVDGRVRTFAIAPPIVTAAPPAGAAADSVTVQVVLPLGPRVPVAHCTEETRAATLRERLALLEEPLSEAVTVAL
jgi:hypothetical protein